MQRSEIVVVGAGAAGLWAAAGVARGGRRVLVLEKTPRCGTKVLASGGTHCNLTTTLEARAAAALFGHAGARFLGPAFRALSPRALRARFEALGVATVEAPLEKIFPASGRARDVRDALEREATDAGCVIRVGAAVAALEPRPTSGGERGSGGWSVTLTDGERLECAGVILCPGGMSYARTGTTGDGYAWIERLGLPLVEPVPALVPLSSPAPWVRALAGVALQDAAVRLLDAQRRVVARRERPILFTHRGLSGPAAMDVSERVARAVAGRELTLSIDLAPRIEREVLRARLIEAAGQPGAPRVARALALDVPKRLIEAALAQAGLAPDERAQGLGRDARHRLVEVVKGLDVPIDGTLGFDQAEVTAGGLALDALERGTMRVRGYAGLWVCGELLDLAGPIGGLNFQSAFATAELAARDAARA